MAKVVVVGGSGFLGSHVSDELSRRGHQVCIFDAKQSPWLREDQQFVLGSLLDQNSLKVACKDAEYLYHFAAVADITESRSNPYRTVETNVMGAASVMEAAKEIGVPRVLYASTMYVYSEAGSFYRASKQAAEGIIESYCDAFDIDYTFLRYGSLYGPRAQEWNGLRSYVRQVIQEGSLKYPGSGEERREYIHVSDAASLSVDALDHRYRNQAITITGSQVMTSKELAEMLFEIAGRKLNVTFARSERGEEHYRITPYRYSPKSTRKIAPAEFIDLGQGILELFEEIAQTQD